MAIEALSRLDALAEQALLVEVADKREPLPGPTPTTFAQLVAMVYLGSRWQTSKVAVQVERCTAWRVRLAQLHVVLKTDTASQRLAIALAAAQVLGADSALRDPLHQLAGTLWGARPWTVEAFVGMLDTKWKGFREWQRTQGSGAAAWSRTVEPQLDAGLTVLAHQAVAGFRVRQARYRALLCDEQGLGKTIEALAVLLDAGAAGHVVYPALVVCPSSVCQTWRDSAERWLAKAAVRTADLSADLDLVGYELDPLRERLRKLDAAVSSRRLVDPRAIARQRRALVDLLSASQTDLLVPSTTRPSGLAWDEDAADRQILRPLVVIGTAAMVLRAQRALGRVRWGSVILDEFDGYLVHPDSPTTQVLTQLSAHATVRLGLSGTALPNGRPIGLYPILRLLDALPFTERRYRAFGRRFCRGGPGGSSKRELRKVQRINRRTGKEEEVRRQVDDFSGRTDPLGLALHLRDIQIRRLKTEVFGPKELPPKTRHWVVVPLGWRERLRLAEAEDEARAELALRAAERRTELEAEAGVQQADIPAALRLRIDEQVQRVQDAAAPAVLQRLRAELGLLKIPAVVTLVRELVDEGHAPIVFCAHIPVAEALVVELEEVFGENAVFLGTGGTPKAERPRLLARWQGGEGKVWVATQAFTAGITATRGTEVIFAERFWDPKVELQGEDRVHRIGQTRPCRAWTLHVPHSVDETVDALSTWKEAGMGTLQGNPNTRAIEWLQARKG